MGEKEVMDGLDAQIEEMERALEKPVVEPDPNTEETELTAESEVEPVAESQPDLTNTEDDDDAESEGEEKPKARRENWKKRYTTNKAASDTTIHEQRMELASIGRQLTDVLTEVDTLRKALVEATASQPDKPVEELFTEKEREVLGDEALMAMRRVTQEKVAEATAPLEKRLADEAEARRVGVQERAESVATQATAQFRTLLTDRVPNLDAIDVDPKFAEWLQKLDDAGQERMRLFRMAQQNSDVERVAQFFNEFANKTAKPASTIERQISPEGNSSAPATESNSGEQPSKITRTFIDKFYHDIRMGKYKGKSKLQEQTEIKIDLAVQKAMETGVPLNR